MPDRPSFEDWPLGEPMTFAIERGHVEPGLTFSPDAVRALVANMTEFVLTQVAKRWQQTNEPPTALSVTVRCDVS